MVTRRSLVTGAIALATLSLPASAEEIVDLTWPDLLPEGEFILPPSLQALIDHDGPDMSGRQPPSSGLRTDLNGQIVRLSGYVVPLEYRGTGVTAFILVPYVGACIHVPPPPANQLVLVTTTTPFETKGMFQAVTVTGMFGAASTSTQIAEIGYALSADQVSEFQG